MRRLLRDERGQTSVELVGMLWWLLLSALVVWQLMLAAWAVDQTANAARTASRVEGRGGDAEKAARNALPSGLRDGMKVKISGETAKLSVRIPIVVPGLGDDRLRVTRSATLPS
jgi:pilus assembly protein CpaE